MRIAKEGYRFIFITVLLAVIGLLADWQWIGLVFGILSFVFAGFFRDPERQVPPGEGLILSPADGRVVRVERSDEKRSGARISIFLSPLDVHVNRAPVGGKVEEVDYRSGKFLAAYKSDASESNERNALKIVDAHGRDLTVTQIAGVLARRIVCYVGKGDKLNPGQRYGLIMFGSRVDLHLPQAARVEVAMGQRVRGGETVIGRFV